MAKCLNSIFRRRRQGASALFLGVFLLLQAMATLPALHALVHHDASDPSHECAVTLFSHGQVDVSSAAVQVHRAPERLICSQSAPEAIFVSTDLRLLPSRGPPVSELV